MKTVVQESRSSEVLESLRLINHFDREIHESRIGFKPVDKLGNNHPHCTIYESLVGENALGLG